MKLHSKTVRAAVVGAVSLTLLAGCAAQPAAHSQVTIKFSGFVPKMEEAIALFNKTHSDVKVDFTRPADEATMNQKLNAAVTAGSGAPDVVQVAYENLNTFVTGGLLDDITTDAGQYSKEFVPWTSAQTTIEGKVYGMPQDIGPLALAYNKAVLDKYGIKAPKTWAEYKSAAEALHKADPTVYITAFPANGTWFTSLAWQNGAKWFDTSSNSWKVNIDSPQSQKVADYWQGLVSEGVVKIEPDFSPEWNKDLNDGKIASWITAAWGPAIIQTGAPAQSGNWAVAPMPEWDAGKPASGNWGGSATAVVKGSKHAKQAVEFMHWLNTDPSSLAILTDPTKGGLFPASLAGQKDAAFRKPNPYFGGQVIVDQFAAASKVVDSSWVWGPTMSQVFSDMSDNMAKATSGSGTLRDALTNMQDSTVKAIKAKGLSVTN